MDQQVKESFKLRNVFDWRVKDMNPEITARNRSLYKVSILAVFAFIITLTPIYAYAYVVVNSPNLAYYYSVIDTINQIYALPGKGEITGLLWSGIVFAIIGVLMLFLFKPFMVMKGIKQNRKVIGVVAITIVLVLSLLLLGLSQYFYSQFHEFAVYEALTTGEKLDAFKPISEFFTNSYSNDSISWYTWQSSTVVWWILFVQIMIVFGISVALQNRIYAKRNNDSIEKYIAYNARSKSLNTNSLIRRAAAFFKLTDKTLSAGMVIAAAIVIIPQLVFTIMLTAPTTHISALVDWTYNIHTLVQDYGIDSLNSAYESLTEGVTVGSYFVVQSLPLIMTGMTIATSFFFISIIVRGEKSSEVIFTVQFIVLFIELTAMTAFATYTKTELTKLAAAWNNDNPGTSVNNYVKAVKDLVGDQDFATIVSLHPLNGINGPFKLEWLGYWEIIGEAIIELSFIVGTFGVVIYGTNKIRMNQMEIAEKEFELAGKKNNVATK